MKARELRWGTTAWFQRLTKSCAPRRSTATGRQRGQVDPGMMASVSSRSCSGPDRSGYPVTVTEHPGAGSAAAGLMPTCAPQTSTDDWASGIASLSQSTHTLTHARYRTAEDGVAMYPTGSGFSRFHTALRRRRGVGDHCRHRAKPSRDVPQRHKRGHQASGVIELSNSSTGAYSGRRPCSGARSGSWRLCIVRKAPQQIGARR